jgi:hypothetical protein
LEDLMSLKCSCLEVDDMDLIDYYYSEEAWWPMCQLQAKFKLGTILESIIVFGREKLWFDWKTM